MVAPGLLIVFANAEPGDEAEFNRWYDEEHIAERVVVPGFLGARRYISTGAGLWKYLALYDTESIAVFESSAYREKVANQSPWSKRMLARFRDPQRSVGKVSVRLGQGLGGTVDLVRLRPQPGHADTVRTNLGKDVLPALMRQPGAIAAALVECDPRLSRPVPEYPPSPRSPVLADDWFIVAEWSGWQQPGTGAAALPAIAGTEAQEALGRFALLWSLDRAQIG